uniref:Uncharacterized protein n=1 Tax=Helianthus annuus TaxID=4232 RepID=A0A251SBH3_HELAN
MACFGPRVIVTAHTRNLEYVLFVVWKSHRSKTLPHSILPFSRSAFPSKFTCTNLVDCSIFDQYNLFSGYG